MENWSVDETRLKSKPKAYEKFRLEQLINFGLGGEKLSSKLLKRYWNKLVIDPHKRDVLKKMLWPKT